MPLENDCIFAESLWSRYYTHSSLCLGSLWQKDEMDFKASSCRVVNDMHLSGGDNKVVAVCNLPSLLWSWGYSGKRSYIKRVLAFPLLKNLNPAQSWTKLGLSASNSHNSSSRWQQQCSDHPSGLGTSEAPQVLCLVLGPSDLWHWGAGVGPERGTTAGEGSGAQVCYWL